MNLRNNIAIESDDDHVFCSFIDYMLKQSYHMRS